MAKEKLFRWWWSVAKLRKERNKWNEKIIVDQLADHNMHLLSLEIKRKKSKFRWMVPFFIKSIIGIAVLYFTYLIYLQGK